MKLTVRANEWKNEKYPGLVGFANVSFDDNYMLEQVAIYQKKSGDYYIKLPSISEKIKDDNGNYIEGPDGNFKKETKEVFHPASVDARNAFTRSIVHAIRDNPGKECVDENFLGDFKIDTARIYPSTLDNNNQVGFGSVSFGDFILENVSLRKKKDSDDLYVSSVSRLRDTKDKDTGEIKKAYVDYFHPNTPEAAAELKEAVVNSYNENLAKGKDKAASAGITADQTNSAAVTNDFDLGEIDMADFEDVLDTTNKNNNNSR
ncbi:MAG: septation protein SpoVG family protein [Ruminococcus sp.]|nr:septation protein SpoVG family protein [Ruminococcus sp.]